MLKKTNRHYCFKSGDTPKMENVRIHLQPMTILLSPCNSTDIEKSLCWIKGILQDHALACPNHSFEICGCPEAFTSTITFMKCVGKTSLKGQERYILKTRLEFVYPVKAH